MDFPSFEKEILNLGERLARDRIDIQSAIAGIESLLEVYIASVSEIGPGESSEDHSRHIELALALARLSFLAIQIMAAGYAHESEDERRLLVSHVRAADDDLHRSFSLLTKVHERERLQFSKQLQEKVGHDLAALNLHLHNLAEAIGKGETTSCFGELEASRELVDDTVRTVRRMILDLGPAVVEEVGLISAVRMYTRQFSSRCWIDVTVATENFPEEIPLTLQVALYRLTQLILDYCRRSKVRTVRIAFLGGKDTLVMIVDEGAGRLDASTPFDPTGKSAEALWALLRVRAELVGAVLHRHARESGVRIELLLPLPNGRKSNVGRPLDAERMPPKRAVPDKPALSVTPKRAVK